MCSAKYKSFVAFVLGGCAALFGCTALSGCAASAPDGRQMPSSGLICDIPASAANAVQVLRTPHVRLRWPTAHRGDTEKSPDNSIQSLTAAAKSGIPLVETDVRMTSDGTPFLFHGRTLQTGAYLGPEEFNGRRTDSISSIELARIKLPGGAGDIPTFAAAMQALRPYKTAAQLDIKTEKPADLNTILEIAADTGMLDKIIVQCDSLEVLDYVRKHYPQAAVLARTHHEGEIAAVIRYSPELVQGETEFMTAAAIETIHASGAKVIVKSLGANVDVPVEWEKAFSLGADVVMTDHAAELFNFSKANCN